MSDKEKKKASLFSSLRRNYLVRPGVEETRPMLPAHPTIKTPAPRPRAAENFEISLRDKSDATAKRGFRVQVPKRMLSYVVLVFLVAPLSLFLWMEVHRVASSHGQHNNEKVPEDHFHHDVLSLLTDEEEEQQTDALAKTNETVIENAVVVANTTDIGDSISKNASQIDGLTETNDAGVSNGTNVEAAALNQTETDVDDKAEAGEKRRLRKSIR